MKISYIQNFSYSFQGSNSKNNTSKPENDNPISSFGEKSKLVKATIVAGLGIGARLLLELADGDFLIDTIDSQAERVVNNTHKGAKGIKKTLLHLGAFAGLVAAFVGAFSLLYTLFKAPSINYQGNINTYKKKKDMDIYIKSNDTEREIYTQMNEKAKTADAKEKEKLRAQYFQMQIAKNRIPDFVK